jgi:hypothetical protein
MDIKNYLHAEVKSDLGSMLNRHMSVGDFKKKDYLANIDNKYKNIFKMNDSKDD